MKAMRRALAVLLALVTTFPPFLVAPALASVAEEKKLGEEFRDEALAHLPQIRLSSEQLMGWRCGRAFAAEPALALPLPLDQAVVVLGPDGILAGMARAVADGLLQPKLVLDAAG